MPKERMDKIARRNSREQQRIRREEKFWEKTNWAWMMEKQDRQDGVNSVGIIEKEIIEKGRKKI